jgi:hypothetical protein
LSLLREVPRLPPCWREQRKCARRLIEAEGSSRRAMAIDRCCSALGALFLHKEHIPRTLVEG